MGAEGYGSVRDAVSVCGEGWLEVEKANGLGKNARRCVTAGWCRRAHGRRSGRNVLGVAIEHVEMRGTINAGLLVS